jgi:hypothetical protein
VVALLRSTPPSLRLVSPSGTATATIDAVGLSRECSIVAQDKKRRARTGKSAFGAALGIWMAQAVIIALVFMPFWNASGSDTQSQSVWEGYGPALIGLLIAPAAAMIVGPFLAWILRLRTAALYALGPVAALGSLALCGFGSLNAVPLAAFVIGLAWNLSAVVLADRNSGQA